MRARDIMTKTVRIADVTTPIHKIAQAMVRHRISAIPIVDRHRKVIGIVSEADLLRRVESGTDRRRPSWLAFLIDPRTRAKEYAKSRGRQARDVMTRTVISVKPNTDVAAVADLMEKSAVKRIPVVDAQNRLVGIITRRDLIAAVARGPGKMKRSTDADISAALRERIRANTRMGETLINFAVTKGRVELSGLAPSEEERDAVRVMAETTPGVRAVSDMVRVLPRPIMAI
jgi:CBS domain-containing protein